MSVPNYLAKIKSSGVYRYVFDKSEIPVSERNSIRLVVGYSEKGPFNTPVYFDDANEFIATHGNISRRMERKGIFFNRMALQALSGGPILALNLKPFNVGKEKEFNNVLAFNADILGSNTYDSKILGAALVSNGNNAGGIYDTNRFWKVTENLFDIDVNEYNEYTKEIQPSGAFANESSYFRIVQTGSHEDAVTIFMRPFKPTNWDVKISEWYSNETAEDMPSYMEAIADTKLSNYFMEIYTFKGKFTNDLFKSDNNSTLGAYGLYPFSAADLETELNKKPGEGNSVADELESKNDAYEKAVEDYDEAVKAYEAADGDDEYSGETSVDDLKAEMERLEEEVGNAQTELATAQAAYDAVVKAFYVSENSLDDEDAKTKDDVEWVKIWAPFCLFEEDAEQGNTGRKIMRIHTNEYFRNIYGEMADALDAMSTVSTSNFVGRYAGITFPSFKDANGSFISIDSIFNKATAYHKCLMALDESLLDDAYDADINNNGEYEPEETTRLEFENVTSVLGYIKKLTTSIEDDSENTTGTTFGYYVDGFTYNSITKADKNDQLVTKILKTLSDYKGLREALTNNVDLDYKYWVDTFQAYPTLALRADITDILQKKFNCLGILNFPPMPDVITASQNGWARTATGGFDMNSINRDSFISLPTESQGASFAAFYTQLKMTDGAQTFYVPSAALVSNLFMQKRATGQPYNIVAGPNHGRINYTGVIGPDYNYARADLDVLEPFGVNAIIYIPRYGIVINSNQTAKQTPVSALSKVHVRELITYIQDTIQDMLYGYQWELNTPSLRDAIKAKADVILGVVQCNGGIYAYNTKCDDQNNTPEIIDNEMVVLDMEIEPARGAGKMVQTLTIHRTGALSSK